MSVSVLELDPFSVNYAFRIGDAILCQEGRKTGGIRLCGVVGGFLTSFAAWASWNHKEDQTLLCPDFIPRPSFSHHSSGTTTCSGPFMNLYQSFTPQGSHSALPLLSLPTSSIPSIPQASSLANLPPDYPHAPRSEDSSGPLMISRDLKIWFAANQLMTLLRSCTRDGR